MCIPRIFLILTLASVLPSGNAWAQSTTNGPLFRVSFAATCQSFDASKNRLVTTRVTDRNIIAQATGVSASDRAGIRQFALVYNPADDSLQVADATGQPIVGVVHFGGAAATGDSRQLVRLTFMFFPGQTNEFGAETNVFGTALITERASRATSSGSATRANITGRLQFTLLSGTPLGATNVDESGTNVEICTGIFTTGGQFPPATTGGGVAGGTTGTNGVVSGTGTNGTTGVTGTTTGTTTTTPIFIITPPVGSIPNTTTTTTTALGGTTGMLPTLTGNGSLPGLGTSIGTGQVTLTPFTTVTPIGTTTTGTGTIGTTPVIGTTGTTTGVGTVGSTTGIGTIGTTTTVGGSGLTGTTTGTLIPSGSLTGF